MDEHNVDALVEEFAHIDEQVDNLKHVCVKKIASTSNREIAKQTAAFATDCILTGKVLEFCHKFFSRAKLLVAEVIEVLRKEPIIEYGVAGAEGIVHQMSAGETIKEVSSGAVKVVKDVLPADFFYKSVINDVFHKLSLDKNRINHILTPKSGKHGWHKIIPGEVTWDKIQPVIEKVVYKGRIVDFNDKIILKALEFKKEIVEVAFRYTDSKLVSIVNAWVKTR